MHLRGVKVDVEKVVMDMIQFSGDIASYHPKLELNSLKLLYLKDWSWCLPLSQGSTYEFHYNSLLSGHY